MLSFISLPIRLHLFHHNRRPFKIKATGFMAHDCFSFGRESADESLFQGYLNSSIDSARSALRLAVAAIAAWRLLVASLWPTGLAPFGDIVTAFTEIPDLLPIVPVHFNGGY